MVDALPPCHARADVVVEFGVGHELLVRNADAAGASDAPTVVRWSALSDARARVAERTAHALLTLRATEVRRTWREREVFTCLMAGERLSRVGEDD